MEKESKYKVRSTSLFNIRNRNELRVIKLLPEILDRYPDYKPEVLDIQDIYALALNNLTPRYVQERSIVLKESVGNELIKGAIIDAIATVSNNPNY